MYTTLMTLQSARLCEGLVAYYARVRSYVIVTHAVHLKARLLSENLVALRVIAKKASFILALPCDWLTILLSVVLVCHHAFYIQLIILTYCSVWTLALALHHCRIMSFLSRRSWRHYHATRQISQAIRCTFMKVWP